MQPEISRRLAARQTTLAVSIMAVTGVSMVAITIAVNAMTALTFGCLVLAGALLVTLRALRHERNAVDARTDDLRHKYSAVIDALYQTIGLQDDVSASHSRRVYDLSTILARQLRLPGDDVRLIQRAAVLADIGKLEIADDILNKKGELNEVEWEEMRRHPELGAKILAEVLDLKDAARIVLHHHERFDGQGYPGALRGDKIPIGARIYSVADAYTAMTSDRPHRKKMSHEMALKEVLRNSLTQFDPDVVRAFVRAEETGLLGDEQARQPAGPSSGQAAKEALAAGTS